jgi:hypothetical protein
MRETPQADTDEFHEEYNTNPLGELVESKAVGPYLIELYDRPIDTRDRDERQANPRSVLSVWVRDTDHYGPYRDVFSEFMGRMGAHEMYRRVDTKETVEEWVAIYSEEE